MSEEEEGGNKSIVAPQIAHLTPETNVIPMPDFVDPLTTADDYDPVVRAKAYELYLRGSMPLQEVALTMSLPLEIISSWSRRGKWVVRKKALEDDLVRSVELVHRKWMVEKKFDEARRQLEEAHALQTAITASLMDKSKNNQVPSDIAIMRLSKALNDATAISARAVGLTGIDDGDSGVAGSSGRGGGKVPLVIVGMLPSVPKHREDIKSTEAEYREL